MISNIVRRVSRDCIIGCPPHRLVHCHEKGAAPADAELRQALLAILKEPLMVMEGHVWLGEEGALQGQAWFSVEVDSKLLEHKLSAGAHAEGKEEFVQSLLAHSRAHSNQTTVCFCCILKKAVTKDR